MCQYYDEIFLLHSLSEPDSLLDSRRQQTRRPGGAISNANYHWRMTNCNRDYAVLSTRYLSLQVVDALGIVGLDRALETARNPLSAESGGAAQPAGPTRPPRFRAALRGLGHRLDLEPDSSPRSSRQLDLRISILPGNESARRRA